MSAASGSNWFNRYLLPGFAFKAVVIGGGYATGRELAEFFLPAGPWGGLAAMGLATLIWSLVATATFWFARRTQTQDYRSFFKALLGPGWVVFEIAYAAFIVLILAVFGAAAGAIAAATLGLPPILGTLALMAAIGGCVAFGNKAVERLFAWVSVLLYGVYSVFLVLALTAFGPQIADAFANAGPPTEGWAIGGITYAGYNIIGAVVILPVVRHMTSDRDAVIAGIASGPLAMLPALLFFVCMCAFLPGIAGEVLPSDYMLQRLGSPLFHLIFQAMIFAALLESGTGGVHAINERIAHASGDLSTAMRAAIAFGLLAVSMLLADRIGLVALIASGYRALAWLLIAIYVLPLLIVCGYRLARPTPEVA